MQQQRQLLSLIKGGMYTDDDDDDDALFLFVQRRGNWRGGSADDSGGEGQIKTKKQQGDQRSDRMMDCRWREPTQHRCETLRRKKEKNG